MAEFEYDNKNLRKVLRQMLIGRMDSSDRTRAIIGGSHVEDALETLLRSRFINIPLDPDNKPTLIDDLFFPHGILGTFSSKIDMCYALGLIGKTTRKDLWRIKEIRNRFAHRMLMKDSRGRFEVVTFKIEQIASHCNNLSDTIINAGQKVFGEIPKSDLSRRYSIYCAFVTQLIFKRLSEVSAQPFTLIDSLLN
jgi:hypothetical protein